MFKLFSFESWSSTSITVDYIPYFFLKNIADYMFFPLSVCWKVYNHSFSRKSFYRAFPRPCSIKSKRPAPPVWKVKYSGIFKILSITWPAFTKAFAALRLLPQKALGTRLENVYFHVHLRCIRMKQPYFHPPVIPSLQVG